MRNPLRNGTLWALATTATALSATLSAQQPAPPGQGPTVDRYVVGQAAPPEQPGFTIVPMTLERATQIALENNLDLKSAKLNPQVADYNLQAARASYLPRYTSTYSLSNSVTPSNDKTDGANSTTAGTQNFNASMNQALPWHGLSFTGSFTNSRGTDTSARTTINPNYRSGLSFSVTQPLLAGFAIDNTRNSLRTAAISRQVADLALQTTIETTRASVRTAYWNLKQAVEQIEISKRALELAQRTLDDNKLKVEIGNMAPIDTVQNEVSVAQAEGTLLSSQNSWETSELAFKRLLASGADDPIYKQTINPIDQPSLSVQAVDIPGAVRTAIEQRLDIVTSRKNLESTKFTLEVTQNSLKPNLSLSAGLNSTGQGSKVVTENGTTKTVGGGYGLALNNLGSWATSGWNVGLNFTLPYGQAMTNSKINYSRGLINLEQAEANLKVQELTITSDVTTAGLNVRNSYKQYEAQVKSRQAQERTTEAAQTRFQAGTSTNFEVVTAQNQLTSSRLAELRALITYVNAVADFERIQKVGR